MLEFFREGGVSMFPILALGLIGVVSGALFMWRPDGQRAGFFVWLGVAQACATIVGIVSDLGAVFTNVPRSAEWSHSPDLHLIVMTGLAECTRPGTMGFSLLGVMALLVAVGYRRMPRGVAA
jgi:hypothetical protein